jgi:hypothetical protein
MLDLSVSRQHAAIFGAAIQGGDNFAGVEQALGGEGAFDVEHLLVFLGAKQHTHRVQFCHTHAVLVGDGSAHGHADFQYLGVELFTAHGVMLLHRQVMAAGGGAKQTRLRPACLAA